MAHDHPDVLKVFADRYRASTAGRTGVSSGDFTLDYLELIKAAGIERNAAARQLAEDRLRVACHLSQGQLTLDTHARDERLIHRVRLSRAGGEAWLFGYLNESSPTEERRRMSELFDSCLNADVPERWRESWQSWCMKLSAQALEGGSIQPFARDNPAACHELMTVTSRLLSWQGESLLRFASCQVCGSSKRLEQLERALEKTLPQATGGTVQSLKDLGLLEKPRSVLLHGPLLLVLPAGMLDIGLLSGPVVLYEKDIHLASSLRTKALRVLTVENEATFWELSKRNHDTLLIHTSFPGRAVLALLARLPEEIPLHHFGDTDPAGFDILRDLRERSGRPIQPLHMGFRPSESPEALKASEVQQLKSLLAHPLMQDCHVQLEAMLHSGTKGDFEQESLGRPTVTNWPFYEAT